MVRGEMQKMFLGMSLWLARTIPMVMAAGSAGGTTIVIRSNTSNTTSWKLSSARTILAME